MQMIHKENYPAERHTVQTKDGYLLTVYRIPAMNSQPNNRKVILLMHGMYNRLSNRIKYSGEEYKFRLLSKE